MKFILSALLLMTSSSALACLPIIGCWGKYTKNIKETKSVCNTVRSPIEWKYCYTPSTLPEDSRVIYYFHGGGGNEKFWLNSSWYPEEIRRSWKEKGENTPHVITVSFGELWVLASRSEKSKSGLYEVFLNEVVPHIEKSVLKNPVNQRIGLGESMGGFNAGTLVLRNPHLFSKVALLCPGLALANEVTSKDVDGYMQLTGAHRKQAEFIIKTRNDYYEDWDGAHADSPLTLIENLKDSPTSYPKIFVSSGDKDEFGFYQGAELFVQVAKAKGLNVSWYPVSGKHCSANIDELIQFLKE